MALESGFVTNLYNKLLFFTELRSWYRLVYSNEMNLYCWTI